jgi:hypothetical protein
MHEKSTDTLEKAASRISSPAETIKRLPEFLKDRARWWQSWDERLVHQDLLGPAQPGFSMNKESELSSSGNSLPENSLLLSRTLFLINQTDLFKMPSLGAPANEWLSDFYSHQSRAHAMSLRVPLESLVFEEGDAGGEVTLEQFAEEFRLATAEGESKHFPLGRAILTASDPVRAARYVLAQCAEDFLLEGSALCRALIGNYGIFQSSLFQILMDEYGGGNIGNKHTTLFERLLTTAGLSADFGEHLWCTLASSFNIPNYLHHITSNPRHLFRMVGMVAYSETCYSHYCRKLGAVLDTVFSGKVDTTYFSEHSSIDIKHAAIAFEEVALPMARLYGPTAVGEMLRGANQFRALTSANETDLIRHIRFQFDSLPFDCGAPHGAFEMDISARDQMPPSSVSNADSVIYGLSGQCYLHLSPGCSINLLPGKALNIPRGIQFSLCAEDRASVAFHFGKA